MVKKVVKSFESGPNAFKLALRLCDDWRTPLSRSCLILYSENALLLDVTHMLSMQWALTYPPKTTWKMDSSQKSALDHLMSSCPGGIELSMELVAAGH